MLHKTNMANEELNLSSVGHVLLCHTQSQSTWCLGNRHVSTNRFPSEKIASLEKPVFSSCRRPASFSQCEFRVQAVQFRKRCPIWMETFRAWSQGQDFNSFCPHTWVPQQLKGLFLPNSKTTEMGRCQVTGWICKSYTGLGQLIKILIASVSSWTIYSAVVPWGWGRSLH